MKVAIVLPDLKGGGVEKMRLHLAEAWLREGYEIDIVLMRSEGEHLSSIPKGAKLIVLNVERYRRITIPLFRYIKEASPDVLLAAMWPLTIFTPIISKICEPNMRVVVSEHNTLSLAYAEYGFIHRKLMQLSMLSGYFFADAIIGVSKGVVWDLEDLTFNIFNKFKVIYNPAYKEIDCSTRVLDNNVKAIITVGSFKQQKNHELLIRAFSKISKKTNVKLIILGEGSLRSKYKSIIKDLKIEGLVLLPGFTLNPEKDLLNADLFVLSSNYEGFGNVIVEALECGLPVVSTDCESGPREILEDGKYGTLVPIDDVDALAEAMIESLEREHDTEALKRRATDFSVDKIAIQYLDVMFPERLIKND